jgi:hypothetical protein
MLFKPPRPTSFEGVKDLEQDRLVRWQHQHYLVI